MYPLTQADSDRTSSNNNYSDAAGAASHAANGLFLLSQAHQELTKREEAQKQSMAQAAAGNGAGPGGSAAKGSSAQSQSAQQPSTIPRYNALVFYDAKLGGKRGWRVGASKWSQICMLVAAGRGC